MIEVILMVLIMSENDLVNNKKLTCYCRNYCPRGHAGHNDLPAGDFFSMSCTACNKIHFLVFTISMF